MRKFLRRSLIVFVFLVLFFSIKNYAADVTVTGKQEHREDGYLTVTSTEKMNSIRIYKKIDNEKFILFYKSNPKTTSSVCRISAKLLSEENETYFKVVIESDTEEKAVDCKLPKIEKAVDIDPSETAKPSWTPSPIPTFPSQTTTPSTSPSTSTSTQPSTSTSPSQSTPASEQPSESTAPTGGEHQYKKKGTKVKSYKDETISVNIEKIGKFYVTKVWVKDPSKQMKKASGDWGKQLKTVNTMLNNSPNAIVGCNGSGFYLKGSWEPGSGSPIRKLAWNKTTEGYLVITGGKILRQVSGQKTNALLGILPSGGFKYYENNPYSDVTGDGVKDTYTFGPMLVYNGKKYKQTNGSPRFSSMTAKAHRCCIGQVDENNYIILSTKATSSLNECANMGLELDCKMLYNFDGGGSTSLWFRAAQSGKGTEVRASSRQVGDSFYFTSTK